MTDIDSYLTDRLAIHSAATAGPWGIGSWRDRSFQRHMTIEPEHGSRTIGDVTDHHEGNANAIVDAHNHLPRLARALQAVMEEHERFTDRDGFDICTGCSDRCEYTVLHPCSSVKAIASTLGLEGGE